MCMSVYVCEGVSPLRVLNTVCLCFLLSNSHVVCVYVCVLSLSEYVCVCL